MSGGSSRARLRPTAPWFPIALLVGSAVAYGASVRTPFLGDDHELLLWATDHGPGAGWLTDVGVNGRYRPLLWLSLAANHAVGGLSPVGYHLVQIVLHAAVAWLVALFAARLVAFGRTEDDQDGATSWVPLVCGGWFLLSPAHVEAVAWVGGRADLLVTALGLLSLLAWIRWRERGGGWAAAATALLLVALLAKETAVVLPAVILAFELWFPRDGGRLRSLRRSGPWLAAPVLVTVAYLAFYASINAGSIGEERDAAAGEGPLVVARSGVQVALRTLFPSLPMWGWVAVGVALVVLAVVAAQALRSPERRSRLASRAAVIGFAATATIVAVVPVARLGVSLTSPAGGRLAYLPSAFATIAVVALLAALWPGVASPRSAVALVAAAAVVLVALIAVEVRPYAAGGQLAQDIIDQQAAWDGPDVQVLLLSPDSLQGVFVGRNGLGPAGVLVRPERRWNWLTEVATVDLGSADDTVTVRRGSCDRCVVLELDDPAARITFPRQQDLPLPVFDADAEAIAASDRSVEIRIDEGADLARYWYVSGGRLVPLERLPD